MDVRLDEAFDEGVADLEELDGFGEFEGFDAEDAWGVDELDHQLIGRDTRRRVRNTRKAPFRYLCNFHGQLPNGQWGAMCTGTLIGPRTVLTAGHCLDNFAPARLRVYPGRNGRSKPFGWSGAARYIKYPGYAGATRTDLGLVHLKSALGSKVGYWRRSKPCNWSSRVDPRGTSMSSRIGGRVKTVNISGYPSDKPGGRGSGCVNLSAPASACRGTGLGAPGRKAVCGTLQYRSFNRTVALQGGMLHYLNDTCPGHSGSPVWVRRRGRCGERIMIGVHVARDDDVGSVANRAVAFTPKILRWIASNTK